MIMNTYTKNGHLHGKINHERLAYFDIIGRDAARNFFTQKGWTASTNDRDDQGNLVFSRTDLKVLRNNTELHIEAATKRSNIFKFIYQGVDIETRKLKYFTENQNAFISMCDYYGEKPNFHCGNELLLIHCKYLFLADKNLSECKRIEKNCKNGLNQTGDLESFYRIPYKFLWHFNKDHSGLYKLKNKPVD